MNPLVYSVKIMGDHVETRITTATKSPISVPYIYIANFQLMVIKHAGKTNNCAVARKFHVAEQNIYHILLPKMKVIIINDSNST